MGRFTLAFLCHFSSHFVNRGVDNMDAPVDNCWKPVDKCWKGGGKVPVCPQIEYAGFKVGCARAGRHMNMGTFGQWDDISCLSLFGDRSIEIIRRQNHGLILIWESIVSFSIDYPHETWRILLEFFEYFTPFSIFAPYRSWASKCLARRRASVIGSERCR